MVRPEIGRAFQQLDAHGLVRPGGPERGGRLAVNLTRLPERGDGPAFADESRRRVEKRCQALNRELPRGLNALLGGGFRACESIGRVASGFSRKAAAGADVRLKAEATSAPSRGFY
jgi:hypothetical protein